jgi:hypothetical protein
MKDNTRVQTQRLSKGKTTALWSLQILVAAAFLMSGFAKLSGQPMMVQMFGKNRRRPMVSLCHRHYRAGFCSPTPRAASCPGRSGVARLHDVRRGSDTSRQTRRFAIARLGPGLPGGVHPLGSIRWIEGTHQHGETREH